MMARPFDLDPIAATAPTRDPSPGRLRVSVVLCTYNGERYLSAMLESLAAQTFRPTRLVLRDDGSSDGGVALVQSWACRTGVTLQVVAASAQRLGPGRAFLTALAASEPADLHLLADQDDVWLPDKIERAWAIISTQHDKPMLYASRLRIVDEHLDAIGMSTVPTRLGFASATCESLLTGCTMALNEPLRLLAARGVPSGVAMHDWWLYLLAAAAGQVHFDAEPTVLYRQHGQNVLGAERSGWQLIRLRWKRFASGPPGVRRNQLMAFRELFSDLLNPADHRLVDDLIDSMPSASARLRVAVCAPIQRQRWHDTMTTRLALATGRF